MDGGEKLLEILRGAGSFGDAVESRAQAFRALALGDIAIDGVESGGAAVNDERSAGKGNVEQGPIFAPPLSFQGEVLTAAEALDGPIEFHLASGWQNESFDGLAHDLRGGVPEQPLKFLVDAQGAERRVNNNERVGTRLKKLLEILTADL